MSIDNPTGCIFAVQTFSLHNGPGIRTTLFLKGCPLRCIWCANPESQNSQPELLYNRELCLPECTLCSGAGAVMDKEGKTELSAENRASAIFLEEVSSICPTEALSIAGRTVSVNEITEELIRDRAFFEESGGGVTLSGGEPLSQPDFTLALLNKLASMKIHTAVDTCGEAPRELVQEVCHTADLLLFDIKTAVTATHINNTGKTNTRIIQNLKTVWREYRQKIIIRIPLIPGINNGENEIQALISLLSDSGIDRADILPYHTFGQSKYSHLGRRYPGKAIPPADKDSVNLMVEQFQNAGIEVSII